MQLILAVFLAQAPELAESSHPRLAAAVVSPEFVSESLRDERPKRNPAFGSNGFGAAKNSVGNFERRLHALHVPILWVTVNWLTFGRTMSSLAVCR